MTTLNHQQLAQVQGGTESLSSQESEGFITPIGLGNLGDNTPGNGYIRILWFKIKVSWW